MKIELFRLFLQKIYSTIAFWNTNYLLRILNILKFEIKINTQYSETPRIEAPFAK